MSDNNKMGINGFINIYINHWKKIKRLLICKIYYYNLDSKNAIETLFFVVVDWKLLTYN